MTEKKAKASGRPLTPPAEADFEEIQDFILRLCPMMNEETLSEDKEETIKAWRAFAEGDRWEARRRALKISTDTREIEVRQAREELLHRSKFDLLPFMVGVCCTLLVVFLFWWVYDS